jgi:hypothetical protein
MQVGVTSSVGPRKAGRMVAGRKHSLVGWHRRRYRLESGWLHRFPASAAHRLLMSMS